MAGRPRKAAVKTTKSLEQWLGNDNSNSEEQGSV